MKKNKEGFTLIELLVVIAIIALLSSLSVIAINRSRMLARDAKRKADLKNIVIALEMYYQEYGVYPRAGSCAYGTNCYTYSTSGLSWLALLKPYISPPIACWRPRSSLLPTGSRSETERSESC
jgi:general secretion pathway protein G